MKRLILALLLLLALGGAAWLAKPGYRGLKSWRAQRLIAQAERLMKEEKWEAVFAKIQSAYQLNPNDPKTIRTVAGLYSGFGQEQAFPFWDQLLAMDKATPDDRRAIARLALRFKRLDLAEKQVLWLAQHQPEAIDNQLIGADFLLLSGDYPGAVRLARRAIRSEPSNAEAGLYLARLLLASPNPDEARLGKRNILNLAQATNSIGSEALRIAVQLPDLSASEERDLSSLVERPDLSSAEKLVLRLALDWKAAPEQRDKLVSDAVRAAGRQTAAEQLALGRWLNQRQLFNATLQLPPPASAAQQQRNLLLVRLDALAGLGKWQEIQETLKADDLLEPLLRELYLARSATVLNEPERAALQWRRIEQLSVDLQPPALLYLAIYCERIGAVAQAVKAYREVRQSPFLAREGYAGLIRIAEASGQTRELRQILSEMTSRFPQEIAPQNDLAYLSLLLGENIPQAKNTAERLVQQNPSVLAYRATLALALLKSEQPAAAEALLRDLPVDWRAVRPGWQAVHSAVRAANGETNLARTLVRQIPLERLKPEERALIQGLL